MRLFSLLENENDIGFYYITTKRDSTLQTNVCSYIWVTQQSTQPSGCVDLGLQQWVWSNPAPNRRLYFINLILRGCGVKNDPTDL